MGRVERRILRVMAALLERGASVHLICAPKSPMESVAQALGAECAPYHLDRFNYVRTSSRVRKYLRRHNPVVVHSVGVEADIIARWAARDMRVAAINTIPCTDWPRMGAGPISRAVGRWADVRTMHLSAAAIVDCRDLAKRLVDEGMPPDHLMVDPPSIDIGEVMEQSRQAGIEIQRPIGPLVGYGGRIEESRGLEHLVAASAILDARGVMAEVIIAGEGPLLKRIQDDVRSSRVRYIGWVDSVPAVLKQLAVAVFPSTAPGVPTSLLEAAALGRPIVASRVEGVEELYEDYEEIRLVTAGDPKALAAAIADLMTDTDAAEAMGEKARHRTLDEYSSTASIERHLALYRRFMRR